MSDSLPSGFVSVADYIAELRRDPEHAKALDEAREPVLRDIIRALLDRLADRDALAERCEKLDRALRDFIEDTCVRGGLIVAPSAGTVDRARAALAAPKDAP